MTNQKGKKFIFLILGSLVFFNIISWPAVYYLKEARVLEVTFFDVGQGDAIFIETPKFHQILIDGGPDSTILKKLGKEMPFWDRTIDLIVLSHPESDHLSGLIEVLKSYKVEKILWSGVKRDTTEYKEWLKSIKEEGAEIFIGKLGQKIIWSDNRGDSLEILYPFESLEGKEVKNSNNTSLIAKLVFGEKSFLFTGDAQKSVEKELLLGDFNLDSDVLKVGHHGSKTSTGENFLVRVSPEIAVISVGKNNYGHPHQEVLDVLEKYGIRTLRTDEIGDIKIFSDGVNLKIKNQK